MAANILFGEISRKVTAIQDAIKTIEGEQSAGLPGSTGIPPLSAFPCELVMKLLNILKKGPVFVTLQSLKHQIDSFETMAKREVTEIKREKSLSFVLVSLNACLYSVIYNCLY